MLRLSMGTIMPRSGAASVRPLSVISPPFGVSRPAIMRSVVVLPQPDGPSRVKNSPGATLKLTWSTTVVSP
jgi:hypothetical protein